MDNSKNTMEFKIEPKGNCMEFRTGSLPQKPVPSKTTINGCITAPADFFNSKYYPNSPRAEGTFETGFNYPLNGMLVKYSKKDRTVVYQENIFDDVGGATITGTLKLDTDLESLHINENFIYTPSELSQKLKMLSILFDNRENWITLVKNLKNFTAEANKKLEEINDDKGNKSHNFIQTLKTSFDLHFTLNCNIFTGVSSKRSFKVEINADARSNNVDLWLESVELKELIDKEVDYIIMEEVYRFLDTPTVQIS